MSLTHDLSKILLALRTRRTDHPLIADLKIKGDNPWNLQLYWNLPEIRNLLMRSVSRNDAPTFFILRDQLSPQSRDLFCPYPWADDQKFTQAIAETITKAEKHIDCSYFLFHNAQVIGHCFLWKAGANPYSLRYGVDVAELGVAVADDYHGEGLGYLQVLILQSIAGILGKDAIELTTAPLNDSGWRIYQRLGFIYTGTIKNPLEIDATEALETTKSNLKFRYEKQMIYVLNEDKRQAVLDYLSEKTKAYEKLTV